MAAEKKTEEGHLPDLEAPKSQIVSRDEVSNFCGRKIMVFVGGICIHAYVFDKLIREVRVSKSMSSMQAISPQYLDVFTSNWVQRFLGLACTALLKLSALIKIRHGSLFLEVLRLFVMVLTATYFNIQQRYNQFCILHLLSKW